MQISAEQLAALSAILRNGSFEAAATELNVTQSAISQRIRQLEDRLGLTLIKRGQPCTGTTAGQRLAKHAEDLALLERQALGDLGLSAQSAPRRVTIAVNADSLATWFAPALADIGDLLFDVIIDDQDHSADWLRRGTVSAAVTAAGQQISTCDVHPLGQMRYVATASPAFVAHWFAKGMTKQTAARAPMLVFNEKDALQHRWLNQELGADVRPPTQQLPSTHAFVDVCLLGGGWGLNPEPLVRDHLRAGRLLALGQRPHLHVPLDWQISRAMAPALQLLTQSVRTVALNTLQHEVAGM